MMFSVVIGVVAGAGIMGSIHCASSTKPLFSDRSQNEQRTLKKEKNDFPGSVSGNNSNIKIFNVHPSINDVDETFRRMCSRNG